LNIRASSHIQPDGSRQWYAGMPRAADLASEHT
jgi:hypothetical protein